MDSLIKLLKSYKVHIDRRELKKALTHNTYSTKSNNSRYVFLGQFMTKGLLADWVFKHLSGEGTQLQHFIGNISGVKKMQEYFDKWKIEGVRIGDNCSIESQKHIFTYGLLGYIIKHTDQQNIQNFLYSEIIQPSDHLFPIKKKSSRNWESLVALCKKTFDLKPTQDFEVNESNIYTYTIKIKDEILAQEQSISFKYARKKCLKKAYLYIDSLIASDINEILEIEKIKSETLAEEKRIKQEKHLARIAMHREKMAQRRSEIKKKQIEKDQLRRKNKQQIKEIRKNEKKVKYTQEEIMAMSSQKIRHLQDKGILKKGKLK